MKKPVSELPVSEIYSHAAEAHQLERHLKLRSDFASEFGRPPAFVARAPGRANMIGEYVETLTQTRRLLRLQRVSAGD